MEEGNIKLNKTNTVSYGFLLITVELYMRCTRYLYGKSAWATKYYQLEENFDIECFPNSRDKAKLNPIREIARKSLF